MRRVRPETSKRPSYCHLNIHESNREGCERRYHSCQYKLDTVPGGDEREHRYLAMLPHTQGEHDCGIRLACRTHTLAHAHTLHTHTCACMHTQTRVCVRAHMHVHMRAHMTHGQACLPMHMCTHCIVLFAMRVSDSKDKLACMHKHSQHADESCALPITTTATTTA